MKIYRYILILLVLTFSISLANDYKGNELRGTRKDSVNIEGAPKVFIDGSYGIDLDHVKRKVNFVNYVRDRFLADVYIMVTRQRTGSGGREFTLTFEGYNKYSGIKDTLKYASKSFDTEDDIRNGFIKSLKMGLVQYVLESPVADGLLIGFDSGAGIETVKDRWDYWVFKIRASGSFSGEQHQTSRFLSGDLRISRITEDWKFRLNSDIEYDEDSYNLPDEDPFTTSKKNWHSGLDLVKALSDHWSTGLFLDLYSNTYRNYKLVANIAPGIEYNFFPYAESTYREVRLNYSLGFESNKYFDETIYNKMQENLIQHRLGLSVEIKQPWGSVDIYSHYSSYVHDMSKNKVRFGGWLSFNIFKGLSLDFGARYSMIHDQLSLKKEDLGLEEILLRRSELATEYDYRFNFGVSYTFGAIYNNIVNPRFGG